MSSEMPNGRPPQGSRSKEDHSTTIDDKSSVLADVWEASDWWWRDCALRGLLALAESGREFTAFDLTEMGVPDPDHPNRWGALFAHAHRQEIIQPVSFEQSRRRSRHAGVCRVWVGVPAPLDGGAA